MRSIILIARNDKKASYIFCLYVNLFIENEHVTSHCIES